MPGAELSTPADLTARPAVLVGQLEQAIGTRAAAELCADLLAGAGAQTEPYAAALPYLAGRSGVAFAAGDWSEADYWPRVWGARGLRYVWVDDVAPAVLAGLGDTSWRVAEMCVKVAGQRGIGAAGEAAAILADHDLPRVREAAVRALGDIGDTEHVNVVRDARVDTNPAVRRAAARALSVMVARLDIVDGVDQT